MKVLLIQDVDNLGYAGDVKAVANGFGRNYLLPQNLAVLATPGALKQAETIRKTAEAHRARETEDARAIANQLADLALIFERRAGETGKLYGSVTSGDIADAIKEKTAIEIDKRKVSLPEPIRNLGEQDVTIKLMIDVTTNISVEVVPLGGILERERLSAAEVAALNPELEIEPAVVADSVVTDVVEISGNETASPEAEEIEAAAEIEAVEVDEAETVAEIETVEVDADAATEETEIVETEVEEAVADIEVVGAEEDEAIEDIEVVGAEEDEAVEEIEVVEAEDSSEDEKVE